MAFSWLMRKRRSETTAADVSPGVEGAAETMSLRIDDGLLMAFGPDGDPIPPSLVKTITAAGRSDKLALEQGGLVDRQRVLDVLDAQQRGPLADRRNDRWIEAMFGLAGRFEDTPADLLANERAGDRPPLPTTAEDDGNDAGPSATEWVTPLIFDADESASMAKADALLVHGLDDGLTLSAGRHDPALQGWILRPHHLPALAICRKDGAVHRAVIDVTAIAIQGEGDRWPITTKHIELF